MTDTSDKSIYFGGAIKALDGNRVGGYLIEYTDEHNKDLDGEFFTADTNQLEDDYPTKGLKVLFHHGLNKDLGVKVIGEIETVRNDKKGLWVEAILKEHEDYKAYLEDIKTLVNKGVLSWSSGALPQSVTVDKNGFIKSWAKIEGSLTHTPANPSGTKIHSLKSIASDNLPKEADTPKEDIGSTHADLSNTPIESVSSEGIQTMSEVKTILSDDEIGKLADELMTRIKASSELEEEELKEIETEIKADVAEIEVEDDEDAVAKAMSKVLTALPGIIEKVIDKKAKQTREFDDGVSKALSQVKGKSKVGSGTHTQVPQISVFSPYKRWEAEDFSFALDMQRSVSKSGGRELAINFDQAFLQEYADKALKSYESGKLNLDRSQVKSFQSMKANEVMYSTQAGYGDEHVPTAWSQQIWEKARRDNVIAPQFEVIEMPSNPYILPVESTDPTVSLVPETTAQSEMALTAATTPDSKIGTGNVTLTAAKLGLLTFISGELAEDGVAGVLPRYRAQAERAILDSIDNVILNGDNATSGNINYDGATPPTTAKYKAFDGLLVDAVVTNSTNAVSLSGSAPTLANIRQMRFLLDRSKQRPSDLCIFVQPEVEAKLLAIDEFLTMDKAGAHATNMSGQIGSIDGIPVYVTNEMASSDADGKITYDGNVVTRGRMVMAHKSSWYVGYRRRMALNFEYKAHLDAYVLSGFARLAFIGQDADSVSALYNIGI